MLLFTTTVFSHLCPEYIQVCAFPQVFAAPSLSSILPLSPTLNWFLPPSKELKFITQGFKSRHAGRRVPRQQQLQITYGTSFPGKHQFLQFAAAREPYKPSEWIVSVSFMLDGWSRGCLCKALFMYTESSVSTWWRRNKSQLFQALPCTHVPVSIFLDRGCLGLSPWDSASYWWDTWPECVPKHQGSSLTSLLIETPSPSLSPLFSLQLRL